jgi:hypothetical protein
MSLVASMGHSCGIHFKAAQYLQRYPQFEHLKPYLRDLPSRPWTVFEATR